MGIFQRFGLLSHCTVLRSSQMPCCYQMSRRTRHFFGLNPIQCPPTDLPYLYLLIVSPYVLTQAPINLQSIFMLAYIGQRIRIHDNKSWPKRAFEWRIIHSIERSASSIYDNSCLIAFILRKQTKLLNGSYPISNFPFVTNKSTEPLSVDR